jgi:hypothetical protein
VAATRFATDSYARLLSLASALNFEVQVRFRNPRFAFVPAHHLTLSRSASFFAVRKPGCSVPQLRFVSLFW